MDFTPSPRSEALAVEVREFIAEHVTPAVIRQSLDTGTMHNWDLHRAMAAKKWLAPTWPVAEGGLDMSEDDAMTLMNELMASGAPLDGGWIITMCAASGLRAGGSEQQKREILPRVVRGEILIALGLSEPDCGSDVAAARTRAVRDGGEWVINGAKMFTTMAHEASYVFVLARTDPDAPKHKGLTMFLVPLDAPGIVIDPVHTLGGERTNVTFYTDVRVGNDAILGELNRGWEFLTYMLTEERGSAFGAGMSFMGSIRQVSAGTRDWARSTRRRGRRVIDEAATRRRLARAAINQEVSELLNIRSIWLGEQGKDISVDAAMAKLFCTDTLQQTVSDFIEMLGPEGLLTYHAADSVCCGEIEHVFRHAPVTTIYGGSSEVLRSVVAHRGLGLPRG
jgi:alkylation response protein AidB-like acyl-CoA dehydrogenase